MKRISQKTAALIALFIGFMSVIAGVKVLLGIDAKVYNILTWLVYYNVIMGIVSIYTAVLIWRNKSSFKIFASSILAMHFMIFIFLKFFSVNSASESVKAMVFRTSIWILIIILSILIPNYFKRKQK